MAQPVQYTLWEISPCSPLCCPLGLRNELLEVASGRGNVELRQARWDGAAIAGHDDHDVCVPREGVNKGAKMPITHLHTLKL